MISEIRKIVRALIEESLNEAGDTAHYADRVAGRLKSMYTYPAFPYDTIADSMDIIRKTNFPPNFSYAITVKRFPKAENTTFQFVDPNTNMESKGNEVWATIRNNRITTIMFRNSGQGKFTKTPVDVYLEMETVKKNYDAQVAAGNVNENGEVDFTYAGSKPRVPAPMVKTPAE